VEESREARKARKAERDASGERDGDRAGRTTRKPAAPT
jgi:hypothetical protein